MSQQNGRIIFITGVSSGFGKALAQEALAAGYRVAGSLRNESQRAEFAALHPGRAYGTLLDVTDEAAVPRVVAEIEAQLGPIEVLVNNAGYGLEGPLEETSMAELRRQFEVNVFGPVALMKAVLPHMRRRRRGHIVNITSMGGYITLPGLSYYHGTKFALEGISESLAKEVQAFGIAVTAVAPGAFRTDWAGRSLVRAPRVVADYDAVFGPQRAAREQRNGRQNGDPVKAARAILKLIESPQPPQHLLLGADAVQMVGEKLAALQREFAAWKEVSESTGYEAMRTTGFE